MPEHQRSGRLGEKLAARDLRRKGLKLLYRNFRPSSGGEIDLVMRDDRALVFVEVKTRRSENFGSPVDFIDHEKRERLWRGGLAWLRMLGNPDITFRFDVVEVILHSNLKSASEIRHLPDEADWGEHLTYSPESPSPFEL